MARYIRIVESGFWAPSVQTAVNGVLAEVAAGGGSVLDIQYRMVADAKGAICHGACVVYEEDRELAPAPEPGLVPSSKPHATPKKGTG
jgi:hypothetical protein